MPELTSFPDGAPCWFDVTAPDPAHAATFYEQIFGWTYQPPADPAADDAYGFFQLNGKNVAGSYRLHEGAHPAWNIHINVADAAATAAKVESTGGTVLGGPFPVKDMGSAAVCADPGGAVFQLWQAGTFSGAELGRERNTVTWVELNTRDKQACADFYSAVLGWQTQGGPGGYTLFDLHGDRLAGMLDMDAVGIPAEAPTYWAIYFGVESADAAAEQCKQLGGSVIVPPMDVPTSRMTVLADPAGAVFTVHEVD